jgi:hypothetical protein
MALPLASTPLYNLTIPSTGKSVSYRPFLVKEEKALMIAQQSEDAYTMITTLKAVIDACLQDKIKSSDLAIFDIEYIFTQLRARSVGELVELVLRCDTCEDPKASVKYEIDLTKIKVTIPEEHSKTIPLYNDVGVLMKYPSLEMLKKLENLDASDTESIFEIMVSCIDSIYDSQQMYSAKDHRPEEIRQFIDNLTQQQFVKLQSFFETMPKLEEKVQYKCPICQVQHDKYVRGLDAFF